MNRAQIIRKRKIKRKEIRLEVQEASIDAYECRTFDEPSTVIVSYTESYKKIPKETKLELLDNAYKTLRLMFAEKLEEEDEI